MNDKLTDINCNEIRTGGISRRRAIAANLACERCGLLIAAETIYYLLSSSVSRSGAAERFHEACYRRQSASTEPEVKIDVSR